MSGDLYDGFIPAGYTVEEFMSQAGHAWRTMVRLRDLETDDGLAWSSMSPDALAERIKTLAWADGNMMKRRA